MEKLKVMLNISSFSLNELLIRPNNNNLIQFFRYIFVGVLSTIVDCIFLYVSKLFISNLYVPVAIGLLFGFLVTFFLSRKIVFMADKKPSFVEVISIGIITTIGVILTEVFMDVFTNKLNIYFMFSKIIVTIIIMIYNFVIKRLFYIYYNKRGIK